MLKMMIPLLVICLLFCSCSGSAANVATASSESDTFYSEVHDEKNKDQNVIFINGHDGIGTCLETGYYYPLVLADGSYRIMFLDYQTQTSIPLCSRPECTHSDETCTSWYPFTGGNLQLAVVDDYLIAISSNGRQLNLDRLGKVALPQVFISHLDGSARVQLQQFSANEDLPTEYAIQGNSLLFLVQNWEEEKSESVLTQIDIPTGETTKLTSFSSLSCFLIGGDQEHLFIKSFEVKPKSDTSEHEGLYDSQNQIIYSYDLENGEKKIVGEYPVKTRVQIFQNKLYIVDLEDSSIIENDLINKRDSVTIQLPQNADRQDIYPVDLIDNHLIIDEIFTTSGETGTNRFAVNLDTHECTPLLLRTNYVGYDGKDIPLIIYAEIEDSLLVAPYLTQDVMSLPDGENGTIELPTLIPNLKIISKDDFFNNKILRDG